MTCPRLGRVLVAGIALSAVSACSTGSSRPAGGGPQSRPAGAGPPLPPPPASSTPATTSATASEPTGAGPTGSPCGSPASPPATYEHVIWIWMENHTWPQVLGDPVAAPYETSLAGQCGTASHYRAVGSPSLPNYLAATSGGTSGIADDGSPASHPLTVDNLFRQVRSVGKSERSYAEDMATSCQPGSAGGYAVKHNPAAYYTGAADRAACRADDLPLPALDADLQAGRLPAFAFVIPNLCHSTHDCGVTAGDTWLAQLLPRVLASAAYRAGTTAVFVIWDESTPMPNLVISPTVGRATVVATGIDHYALLRTTEDLLGLSGHLGAAGAAPSLRGPFHL